MFVYIVHFATRGYRGFSTYQDEATAFANRDAQCAKGRRAWIVKEWRD